MGEIPAHLQSASAGLVRDLLAAIREEPESPCTPRLDWHSGSVLVDVQFGPTHHNNPAVASPEWVCVLLNCVHTLWGSYFTVREIHTCLQAPHGRRSKVFTGAHTIETARQLIQTVFPEDQAHRMTQRSQKPLHMLPSRTDLQRTLRRYSAPNTRQSRGRPTGPPRLLSTYPGHQQMTANTGSRYIRTPQSLCHHSYAISLGSATSVPSQKSTPRNT